MKIDVSARLKHAKLFPQAIRAGGTAAVEPA
jgi:hypothetical protein